MDLALRMGYRIPVFGWLLRDAVRGAPDAKYYFLANLVVVLAALVTLFGYPFFICLALMMAGLGLIFVITLTAADLLDRKYFFEHARRSRGREML